MIYGRMKSTIKKQEQMHVSVKITNSSAVKNPICISPQPTDRVEEMN